MGPFSELADPLKNGAVGFMPSDTIYGLSCLATNRAAVERIHKLKGRDADKPFVILLADTEQAQRLGIETKELKAAGPHWPAPLTVIVPATLGTPYYLHRGKNSLAVRVPNNGQLRELLKETGPLVSTSANPQGMKPARNISEAKKYFGERLDFYLDVGELAGRPSTITALENGQLKVLRQGAYVI